MEKPFKFHAVHKITKEERHFNYYGLRPYQPSGVSDDEYEWIIYIDIRYDAKLRLYNYINKIPPRKSIYEGTEIGKSIPILNF